jgi:hypothetical protein
MKNYMFKKNIYVLKVRNEHNTNKTLFILNNKTIHFNSFTCRTKEKYKMIVHPRMFQV